MPLLEGFTGPVDVEIDRIDPRPAIEMRTKEDAEAIADYAADFDELPPIQIVADQGDKHWTVDGSYRLRAARLLGRQVVPCLIRRGTFEDAFHAASRANGDDKDRRVRVTNADKQARVRAALAHPVMGRWSQHRIADVCAVTQQFVGLIQHRHDNGCHVGVEGKDGQSYSGTRPAMSRAQRAEVREKALAELRRDHTQPNTVIAERLGVDWRMVKKVREDGNIEPSGAKGGSTYHKPKAPVPPQTTPLLVEPAGAELATAPAAMDDQSSRPTVAERWPEVEGAIMSMFRSWPEADRPHFAFRLAAFSDTLFGLCPEVEDQSDRTFS